MKKLIAITFVLMCALTVSAQTIYSSIEKYDKFDDVIWKKKLKTLIIKTDSSIIVETKGQAPVEYLMLGGKPLILKGSKDSIVNIAADLYGYEELYVVFTKDDFVNKRRQIIDENRNSGEKSDDYIDNLTYISLIDEAKEHKLPEIIIRTISKFRYTFMYDRELFWIRYKDGSRLIYRK